VRAEAGREREGRGLVKGRRGRRRGRRRRRRRRRRASAWQ